MEIQLLIAKSSRHQPFKLVNPDWYKNKEIPFGTHLFLGPVKISFYFPYSCLIR